MTRVKISTQTGLLLGLAACVVSVACSSSSKSGGGGGATAVTGFVSASSGTSGTVAIAGATVEEVGASNSTVTASNGSYTLMLTSNATAFIKVTASTYVTLQKGLVVPAGGTTLDFHPPSQAEVGGIAAILGLTIDPTKGIFAVNFATTGTGYGATISATHGSSFAFNSSGAPVNSTTTLAGDHSLIFPNVATGSTTVTAVPPGSATCTAPAIVNYPINAATITEAQITCP